MSSNSRGRYYSDEEEDDSYASRSVDSRDYGDDDSLDGRGSVDRQKQVLGYNPTAAPPKLDVSVL